MASGASGATADSHCDFSPELLRFLSIEDEAELRDVQAPGTAAFSLGDNLDITSTTLNLEGVGQELEQFSDHEVLKAILDQGCDPKEYSRQYEAKLRAAEVESVQDYITERDNLVHLHEQIKACDGILASMEGMLGKFQSDLGNISSEIRYLQDQSQSMSVKLRNRKATQEKLGAFIDSIAIPQPLIAGIVQGEVDDAFLAHMEQLHAKLVFCESDSAAQGSAALRDVAPELQRLRARAVAKSRDFLMQKIYLLRRDKTNIQILQQNVLFKYKYLVGFCRQHGKEVFDEIRAAYIDTLSRVLSSKFRAYMMAMEKLQVTDVATAADLVGSPEVAAGGMMSMFSRAIPGAQHKADIFALGDRAAVLTQLDAPAIIPHVAESAGQHFHYEVLFRSLNKLVMDTAVSEHSFCTQFFAGDAALFGEVFNPTLQALEQQLSTHLQEMHDMVGLLLMIRINDSHAQQIKRRKIQCLGDYLDRINLALWPRLKALLDLQLGSLRAFNPSQHPWTQLKPHFITPRYAHLTAAMLLLNGPPAGSAGDGAAGDGPLDSNISRMRNSMVELLLRLSRGFAKKKQSTIFLILNHNLVLMVFKDTAAQVASGAGGGTDAAAASLGPTGQQVAKEFEDQLSSCTTMYVEEVLAEHFGRLITFIKKAETAQKVRGLAPDSASVPGYGPKEAAPIVSEFSARWSGAIEALHKEVMTDFSSATGCGREVLKAAMTQLLLYYTRLLELLKRSGPEGQVLVRDAVTVPSIMYEIRRYNKG